MTRPLLEIVCCSAEDCRDAELGGADRVELCSAIEMGGLTPSMGMLHAALAVSKIPIMAMVRPRSGGFCYTTGEYDEMQRDQELMLAAGAKGVVFGILTPDRKIDADRCRILVEKCKGADAICHRSFDATVDPFEALETLVDVGVKRLLTSGQRNTVPEGADLIKQLVERANGRIEILPGSGLNAENVQEIVAKTGVNQVHLTAFENRSDSSMFGVEIPFNGRSVSESAYRGVSADGVKQISARLGA